MVTLFVIALVFVFVIIIFNFLMYPEHTIKRLLSFAFGISYILLIVGIIYLFFQSFGDFILQCLT